MNKTRIILLTLVACLAITFGCKPAGPSANQTANVTEGISVGNRAIDFQLQTVNGTPVKLSDYRGKPVLLNFWATWCGPCQFEVPFLQQINDSYASKGLVLLAVDLTNSRPTETPDAVQKFMADHNVTMTVVMDPNKQMGTTYSLTGIPTTLMLDKDGIIRFKIIGAFADKAAIETALKTIMP